jgi:hypothetical protein
MLRGSEGQCATKSEHPDLRREAKVGGNRVKLVLRVHEQLLEQHEKSVMAPTESRTDARQHVLLNGKSSSSNCPTGRCCLHRGGRGRAEPSGMEPLDYETPNAAQTLTH